MLPVLQIGGLAIPLPPLVLLLSLYFALEAAQRQATRRGLDGEVIYTLGFNSLILGLLAARLAFVLLNLKSHLSIRPIGRLLVSFVTPMPGSEIALVGLVVGLGVAAFNIWRHGLDWARTADAYALGAATFVVGLWLAHLLSGDAYGIETNLPWGVNLWGATRHPTQVYHLLASGGILALLWTIEPTADAPPKKRRPLAPYHGFVAQLFVTLTSAAILILEPLRADSVVVAGGYRAWQIGALVALVGSLALFARRAPQRAEGEGTT